MRPSIFRILTLTVICWFVPLGGAAQQPGVSAKLHPWGLFNPGAWKTVHVATETLNEHGQVISTSTTDTKTTLVDLDNGGVTLQIQACIEVAGKRFEADPQIVKQGFHGQLVGPNFKIKDLADGEVLIEGQKIACKVQQLESVVSGRKTVTKIYYSTSVSPYVLKRESVTTDPEGKSVPPETRLDVIALSTPRFVRDELKNVSQVKTVEKNDNGSVTTWADVLPEVPGGVIRSDSQETDKAGRLVRRSTLRLIDYNEDPSKDRTGIFSHKRHRSKSISRYAP